MLISLPCRVAFNKSGVPTSTQVTAINPLAVRVADYSRWGRLHLDMIGGTRLESTAPDDTLFEAASRIAQIMDRRHLVSRDVLPLTQTFVCVGTQPNRSGLVLFQDDGAALQLPEGLAETFLERQNAIAARYANPVLFPAAEIRAFPA